MKILLITPPLLQPNAPYAATPLLAAWLKSLGHDAVQADLSLQLLLRLFSAEGLGTLAEGLGLEDGAIGDYLETIGPVMELLQNRHSGTAMAIAERGWLPEGEHVARAYDLEERLGWNFRGMDVHDRAKYLASLYLDDIADAAAQLDPRFGFSRYAEKLAASLPSFEPVRQAIEQGGSVFMQWLEELVDQLMDRQNPEMVVLTVPFPGCLLGALAIARRIKQTHAGVHVTMGGGYANTELRELRDPGIFDYVDTISLDSGFLPLQRLAEGADPSRWVRTYACVDGKVQFHDCTASEIAHNDLPPPDYDGLELDRYFGLMEVLNPVTSLWSDGRWNRLVLAHGCAWSRCAFCDTTIDYICRYDPADPATICNWIEQVMQQTGSNGFHFVDEALPPSLLNGLCDEILCRGLQIEWWGNIRFENRFSTALVRKMADSGCIAVTGGLETCCDRTLQLMQKGISVQHATRVLSDFSDAGILTHAYLMYGFPTQTLDETLLALETVRTLFDQGILHSAYWHRFALTAHSAISSRPDLFGIELEEIPGEGGRFAINEIPFSATFDHDLDRVGQALKTAVYNFQFGAGLDVPVRQWLK